MRVVVGPVSEFPPGARRIVPAGVRSIGVFRVGDRFYGIRNRCPHQGGPLCLGHMLGDAVADGPGRASVSAEPLRIACPWHGWEYDLDSGCPHQGGPLCLGHMLGDAVADGPGRASVSAEPLRIACPWHGWEYDLDS